MSELSFRIEPLDDPKIRMTRRNCSTNGEKQLGLWLKFLEFSGIPYIMDAYREEAEKILSQ